MSLFQSIKGTLQSVQQDISSGLRSLTSTDKPEEKERKTSKSLPPIFVNYDAGGEILQRYQTTWKDLYQFSEESAQRAEDLDAEIGKLYVYYDRQEECLTKFHEAAANLPVLLNQLQGITDSLAHVEEACDKVEAALVFLEDVCEEQDLLRNKSSHRQQLQAYKDKKSQELEGYKVKLAQDHARKVEEVNKKKQNLLKERQEAFQDQFTNDIDYYKKYGKPGRLPSTPESDKKLDLADVEIEEDQSALDDFLGPSTSDQTDQTEPTSEDVFNDEDDIAEIASEITSPSSDFEIVEKSTSQEDETGSPLSSPSDANLVENTETSPDTEKSQDVAEEKDANEHSSETNKTDQSDTATDQSNQSDSSTEKTDQPNSAT